MSEIPYIRTAVDIRLGDYYREFDVDQDTLIRRMRDEGLTDEQIATTSLHFSADVPSEDRKYGQVAITQGSYRKGTGEITMHPLHIAPLHQMDGVLQGLKASTRQLIEGDYSSLNHRIVAQEAEEIALHANSAEAGKEVSETLYHEVRHRRNDVVEPPEGMRAFRAKIFGRPAVAYFLTFYSLDTIGNQIEQAAHLDLPQQLGVTALSLIAAIKVMAAAQYSPEAVYAMNPDEVSAREAAVEAPADLVSFRYRSYDETAQRKKSRESQAAEVPLNFPVVDAFASDAPAPKKRWWHRGRPIVRADS